MTVPNRASVDKVDVRRMTEEELSRMGVRLAKPAEAVLQCLRCKGSWEPVLDSAGKLPPDFWKCPVGCNT